MITTTMDMHILMTTVMGTITTIMLTRIITTGRAQPMPTLQE